VKDRDSIFHAFCWSVAAPAVGLLLIGLLFVWSTTSRDGTPLLARQALFVLAGALAGAVVMKIGVRNLAPLSGAFYLLVLGLLVAMPVIAHSGPGLAGETDRWISLGFGFKLQPSEFMKLALVFALAWHLRHRGVTNTWGSYAFPFLITAVPWFFVMRQPDLGSSLVLLPVFLAMVTVSGARGRHVALLATSAAVLLPVAYFVPGVLREYQRERLDAFLKPIPALMEEARELRQQKDHEAAQEVEATISRLRRGTGRQQFYSVVAIGSGGVIGQGLGDGAQNLSRRVFASHADFIFAAVGEEWGLFGTSLTVFLYVALVGGVLAVAWRTREPFGRLLCVGVAALIGSQALMNLGIATGMLPVTGLPLPLVSYGGSSIVSTLVGLACVMDVARQRTTVFFES